MHRASRICGRFASEISGVHLRPALCLPKPNSTVVHCAVLDSCGALGVRSFTALRDFHKPPQDAWSCNFNSVNGAENSWSAQIWGVAKANCSTVNEYGRDQYFVKRLEEKKRIVREWKTICASMPRRRRRRKILFRGIRKMKLVERERAQRKDQTRVARQEKRKKLEEKWQRCIKMVRDWKQKVLEEGIEPKTQQQLSMMRIE